MTAESPLRVVYTLRSAGARLFYDGKFKDIPNTIAGVVTAVTRFKVWMFNLHCLGGKEMMVKARKTAEEVALEIGIERPLILGVTILTSLKFADLEELGLCERYITDDSEEQEKRDREEMKKLVRRLAYLAQECGLDGVIASPREIKAIRDYCQPEFLVVTPGVRPEWSAAQDQKRVMTPSEAVNAGADYLVIGRPITKPPTEIGTPVDAAQKITEEITAALNEK